MPSRRSRLLILGWHNVEGTWTFPARPGWGRVGLAAQLSFLQRSAHVVPLEESLAALAAGNELPSRAVALTFDDGYADTLRLAVPMLEKRRLPATFFLVPDLLDGRPQAWWETLGWAFRNSTAAALDDEGLLMPLDGIRARRKAYEAMAERLKRRNRQARQIAVERVVQQLAPTGSPPGPELFLNWSGAEEVLSRGFAVGSHTMAHAILTEETAVEQQRDLATSRQVLADRLGGEMPLLAYPNGTVRDFDAVTVDAARRAGYSAAVTTVDGFADAATPPYETYRSVVYPERGPLDVLDAVRNARQEHAAG